MNIDIQTLIVALSAIFASASLVMINIHRLHFNVQGTLYWAYGSLAITCSHILFSLNGILPDFITIVLANTISIYGLSIFLSGFRIFNGRSSMFKITLTTPMIIAPLTFWYSQVTPSFTIRIVIWTLMVGVFLGAIVYELLRGQKTEERWAQRFTGYATVAFILFLPIRIIETFIHSPVATLYRSGPITVALCLWGIVFAILFTSGVIMMISERLQEQQNMGKRVLKDRETSLKSLYKAAPIGIGLECNRIMKQVNTRLCKMVGYSRKELLEKDTRLLYPSDEEYEYVGKERSQQIGKETILAIETRFKRKNGQLFDVLLRSSPLDYDDVSKGVTFTVLDITKRKTAEKNLKASEEKYRSMMKAMPDQAYICSPDFRIEFMNRAMIDRLGHDATGELCYNALFGHDEKCPWCVFEKVRKGQTITYEQKDSETNRYYLVKCSPVNLVEGQPSKLSILRDVTDLKLMEKERIQAEAKLQQALKMESIGTLAGGIAHDFNNILSSVIGFTELAMDDAEENTILKENLGEVFKAGLRAKDLVKQILNFARQSDGETKPVQVSTIAKEGLKFIRSSIPTTIEIKQSIESNSLIMADPTQIHQIAMNLCTNAAQAMETDGGVLSVGLTDVVFDDDFTESCDGLKPGKYLKLSVSDTGPGIPPEILESIFEPYFTTKAPGKGTGMGLATVYGIVKQNGGDIVVDSNVGKGCTFNVYLPITKKRSEAEHVQTEALPSGSEHILVVDDEPTIAKMIQHMLERLGYHVTIRTNSMEVLELFRMKSTDFDLVITDMTMPGMTGDKLAEQLMIIRPEIPVMLYTGYNNKISYKIASEIGIKGFAYKPVVKSDLAKTVRKVLDNGPKKQAATRILLIDDEPGFRKLFIKKLAGTEYEIIEAGDGKEGLSLYHKNRPDLVVTDLVMPEKEGIETIIELKKAFPDVKIIAISGGGRNLPDVYLNMAKTLGARQIFTKPVKWSELIKTLNRLLN